MEQEETQEDQKQADSNTRGSPKKRALRSIRFFNKKTPEDTNTRKSDDYQDVPDDITKES